MTRRKELRELVCVCVCAKNLLSQILFCPVASMRYRQVTGSYSKHFSCEVTITVPHTQCSTCTAEQLFRTQGCVLK